MKLLILFIGLSILNVILNTFKTTITVRGGKLAAASINAITFFVYTYVIISTTCDLPMHLKAAITGVINFIGVYAVKWFEEKARKDKLWKVECTVPKEEAKKLKLYAEYLGLSFNYIDINKYVLFNFYCPTQKDSQEVKDLLASYNAKYFVAESKVL